MSKSLEALAIILDQASKDPDWWVWESIDEQKQTIERELKAFEVIDSLFNFSTALRFPDNQPMLMIVNKRKNEYWEIPLTKEQYETMKEVIS